MNPQIILSGAIPDFVNTLDQANMAGQRKVEMGRQNALADLYRTQGANILAGDQGAINALAGFDPAAAMGLQQTRQQMAYSAEEMQMKRDEARRNAEAALAEQAASLDAAKLEEDRAKLESALAAATRIGDAATWDNYMGSIGQTALVGRFAEKDILIAEAMGLKDALDSMPKPPTPLSGQGKFNADKAAGFIPEGEGYQGGGVTVNMGGGSDKQVFDSMEASATAARSAATGLASLAEAEKAMEDGIISGAFADERLGAAKLGALFGVTDPKIIENTEAFRAAIAPQVAAIMKATVGSTQISNADREFAERAAGGSISLDAASINRLLGIMKKAGQIAIDAHNARLDAVYPETPDQTYRRERALFVVQSPIAATPPADGQGSQQIQLSPDLQGVYDKYK